MKFFPIIFLLISLSSCSSKKTGNDFDKFVSRFIKLNIPITFNDNVVFANWRRELAIDSNSIYQFELIAHHVDSLYPILNWKDFKCTTVGRYETKNYFLLMYKMYTSVSENGKPVIVLAAFTRDGKKTDEITAMWTEPETKNKTHTIVLNIPEARKIEIREINTINGYLNGQMVPKKTNLKIIQYEINKEGKLIKLLDKENNVFSDNNSKILEEVPEK